MWLVAYELADALGIPSDIEIPDDRGRTVIRVSVL